MRPNLENYNSNGLTVKLFLTRREILKYDE